MIKPFFAFALVAAIVHSAQAQEYPLDILKSQRVQAIQGQYRGEIRFQSSDGLKDQLIQPQLTLSIQIQPDSLRLQSTSDLLGHQCHSKLGEILELKTFSEQDSRVVMAQFAFNSGKCFEKYRAKSLTLIVWQNDHKELIAETLLNSSIGLTEAPKQNLFIHGYFTQTIPRGVPNRAPAIAHSGTL